MWAQEVCQPCRGSGYIGMDGYGNSYLCESCDGFGTVLKNRQLIIMLPDDEEA